MKSGKAGVTLVAGGAGFLGSHLCDALISEGYRVVCLDNFLTGNAENISTLVKNPRFDLIEADVIDPLPAQARRRYDQVFNLACAASPPLYQADPEHTLMTSVLGSRHLLRLCQTTGARYLLASTSEVYGDPEVHPQVETYRGCVNPIGPRACYDEGKRAAETLAFDFARGGRCEVRVARIFNTYGPRLDPQDGRVVSNVVTQALAGEDVTVYGDGRQTRSFCYVDDMVEALIRLMRCEADPGGPINLGNPAEISINELVERVMRLTGSSSKVVRRPLPTDDPKRRRPDIGRAQALLGWSPRTPIDMGLRAVIGWFEAKGRSPAWREAQAGVARAV